VEIEGGRKDVFDMTRYLVFRVFCELRALSWRTQGWRARRCRAASRCSGVMAPAGEPSRLTRGAHTPNPRLYAGEERCGYSSCLDNGCKAVPERVWLAGWARIHRANWV